MTPFARTARKPRLGKVLERGIVACRRCGKPHDKRRVIGSRDYRGRYSVSWGDPTDGHVYDKESAEETALRWMAVVR